MATNASLLIQAKVSETSKESIPPIIYRLFTMGDNFIYTKTVLKSSLKILIVMTMAQMQSIETVVLIQIGIT